VACTAGFERIFGFNLAELCAGPYNEVKPSWLTCRIERKAARVCIPPRWP